jgi:hypothetical protein
MSVMVEITYKVSAHDRHPYRTNRIKGVKLFSDRFCCPPTGVGRVSAQLVIMMFVSCLHYVTFPRCLCYLSLSIFP